MKSVMLWKRITAAAGLVLMVLAVVTGTTSAQHPHGLPPAQPGPTPAASPMPGMSMPAPSPTPTPAPMPGMSMPMPMPSPTPTPTTMPGMQMPGMGDTDQGQNSLTEMRGDEMLLRTGRGTDNFLSFNQMGSGTSWQPTTSPMFMWQQTKGPWLLMYHGEFKIGINDQNGPRGVTKFESENWIMPMAVRHAGPGTLELRGMFSLEPFTFSPGGSPQLFQTGETYQNRPLVDKQHPHDLFMELSGTYTVPIGDRATWFGYLGLPGEPALGPPAFMHRPSASENPAAPLSHHLQDSSHISFGVVTTGFTYRWFKLEGSAFNGREPDEDRYDIEFHPWNSHSVRVSAAPTKNWVAQWSYGWLHQPEVDEPGNIRRMTASLSYNQEMAGGNWASSLIWGRNVTVPGGLKRNGYLAETTFNFHDLNYVYSRLELTDKNDLLDAGDKLRLGLAAGSQPNFRIAAFTFGAVRDFWTADNVRIGLGVDATFYQIPRPLDTIYGGRPAGFHFFLRIRPGRMKADMQMTMPKTTSTGNDPR